MKIFLTSNMYPSSKDSLFGVFVKNFRLELKKNGVVFPAVSIIEGKRSNNLSKALTYLKYYLSVCFNFIFKDYDLVYVHFMSHNAPVLAFLFFLFKKKKPLVINVHGDDVTASKGKKIDNLNKFILKKVDLVVVPSTYFKKMMLENYPFLTENQIFVSPSGGVDATRFYPIKMERNEIPILGMISRIDKGKGWDDFIKALKGLREKNIEFKAIIAGQGLQEKDMLEMIREFNLQDRVEFLGLVKQEELVQLYNKMDVMVFPTKREAESLGLVGVEAMSCGTPVIGGNIAGPKTYINHNQNGLLFEPGNVSELEGCIERYLKLSSEEKSQMKNAAIKTAEEYESGYVMNRLLKQLKTLCIKN
ncbi:glycosyltransferase family 4 protein [Aequorivita sp. H23M31]|uniref:Glycosyltransferase family 4 protein n=1 Tax=Aequorivita ciconiae TaxID=2494375 RepID=A0A410G4J5_9FLAO|nr:glycosyltransferase family 4 protein [Aequorivita sp. H23M31]QAA82190.1 glycosyltransferase family 4 protein [Aequorivita sp. H23M31]